MKGYSRQHSINHYYVEKAYRDSLWAHFDTFFLDDLENDFLELKPMEVMTDDYSLLGWN